MGAALLECLPFGLAPERLPHSTNGAREIQRCLLVAPAKKKMLSVTRYKVTDGWGNQRVIFQIPGSQSSYWTTFFILNILHANYHYAVGFKCQNNKSLVKVKGKQWLISVFSHLDFARLSIRDSTWAARPKFASFPSSLTLKMRKTFNLPAVIYSFRIKIL